jgi:hypothetical protein
MGNKGHGGWSMHRGPDLRAVGEGLEWGEVDCGGNGIRKLGHEARSLEVYWFYVLRLFL